MESFWIYATTSRLLEKENYSDKFGLGKCVENDIKLMCDVLKKEREELTSEYSVPKWRAFLESTVSKYAI